MEDEIAPAPQSIVIQAGTPGPIEIATTPPEQVEAQTEESTPAVTSASGVTKEAVENYITVMDVKDNSNGCLLYTSPSPRDQRGSRMPSSA